MMCSSCFYKAAKYAVSILILAGFVTPFVCPATIVGRIGLNFTGSTFLTDSPYVPPDCDGAIGPAHYVEFINGRFSVYNKSTGSRVKTLTAATFWSQAGVSVASHWDVTDPRIFFDSLSQRWITAQVDFDTRGIVNSNHFLVAVSVTTDPTGTWKAVSIPSDPGGNNFADFPTLGFDSQGVYLSGDLFDASGIPVGPTLLSIPKAGLLAGTPIVTNRTSFGVMSYDARGYILQPVVCMDGSSSGNVLSTDSLGFDGSSGDFATNDALRICQIQNAAGPGGAVLTDSTLLTVPGYVAPFDPFQPDGTQNLDDGDSRFSSAIYQVGGVLYAVHSTEVNDRAALMWYRIDAGTSAVLESGAITDPIQDLYYGSIAANSNGTVVIGFNGSSVGNFVSCYAVVGEMANGATTFGTPMLLKAGLTSYQNTDSSGYSRWGDYSSTSVDPADPTKFWTIQMYPSSASGWSTQITQILTSHVGLSISKAGTNVVVSWSNLASNFQLQSNADPSNSASWSDVAVIPTPVGQQLSVTLPILAGQQQFFRLRRFVQ
jgi:hypothetical protein